MCDTHVCCLHFEIQEVPRSLNVLSYLKNVYRSYGLKNSQNWSKMCLFFEFLEKFHFRRVSKLQKFSNDSVSYASIGTQLRPPSQKMPSLSDHISRRKRVKIPNSGQNCTGYTILLTRRISTLGEILTLCSASFSRYVLKPIDRGLKKVNSVTSKIY